MNERVDIEVSRSSNENVRCGLSFKSNPHDKSNHFIKTQAPKDGRLNSHCREAALESAKAGSMTSLSSTTSQNFSTSPGSQWRLFRFSLPRSGNGSSENTLHDNSKPHYKHKPPLQVQAPKGGCLNFHCREAAVESVKTGCTTIPSRTASPSFH